MFPFFNKKAAFLSGTGICLLLILALWGTLPGCGFQGFARMRSDNALMVQYQDRQLPEQLNYYYCGRENLPYAVVGVDPAYSFVSKFWFPIEYGPKLYHKIDHLSNLEPGQDTVYAKTILGPSQNTLGLWFSYYHSTGVRVDESTRQIEIFNPYKPESMMSLF